MSLLYEESVRRGVEFLDSEEPAWRDKIDPERLHLASCNECVLGQVFGDFETGCDVLGLEYWDAELYGFVLDSDVPQRYSWLTRTWKRVLAR